MKHEILMPKLGLTMKSGIISEIKKEKKSYVLKGEVVAEFETDKITGEITASCDGYISEILCSVGDEIPVLKPVFFLVDDLSQVEEGAPALSSLKTIEDDNDSPLSECKKARENTRNKSENWTVATPMARRIANELGVSIENVCTKHEILLSDEVKEFAKSSTKATHLAKVNAEMLNVDLNSVNTEGEKIRHQDVINAYENTPVKKMSSMRKTIARRLSESKQTIPHVYFKKEIDVTEMLRFVKSLDKEALGVKVSLNDVILKVVASVLEGMPEMRVQTDGTNIIRCNTNIGMAVSVDEGLVVPVIENAAEKSLKSIALATKILATKARRRQLGPKEIGNACFTVSNLGAFGVDEFYAIINPPEAAILSVGALRKVPRFISDAFVPRDVITMCLSADHRLIDGALAAEFLKRLSEGFEKIQTYVI